MGVSSLISVAILVVNGRFDYRPVVVGGIVGLSILILTHSLIRRRADLLEMITLDTVLYLAMAVLADLPEVAIFVALAQTFIVFFFVRPRDSVALLGLFSVCGLGAASVTILWQVQRRSAAETVLIVAVVSLMTMIPVAWVLVHAGAEIHRRREQEETLAKEKDDLLVDKDRFVASVSHELRTPLTAVVGLAHTLAETGSSLTPAERAEFLGILVEQSEDVAAIVDDLLVAARAETGHLSLVPKEVDLAQELAAVLDPGTEVVDETVGRLLVTADPVRVRQILRNLISNSHRYGGPNRRVRLSNSGINGLVSIEDDGKPIASEDLALIFTAYGRAHDRPGRTDSVGLGLTVSRQLARLMDGDVVYAHDAGWISFSLVLPTAISAATRAIYEHPETALRAHRVPAK